MTIINAMGLSALYVELCLVWPNGAFRHLLALASGRLAVLVSSCIQELINGF